MLLADFVTELAHFPVGAPVASVGMIVYKVDGIEDDVIMAMPLVDVGSNHILILAFQPFICKLLADLMCLFRRDFSDIKRLDQVPGNYLRHLHSLLDGKVARPLKFFCRSIAGSTPKRGNIELVIRLLRIKDVGKRLVYSSPDWLDFSNCHISFCLSFSSVTSSS